MGAYLTHPKTDKYSIEDANDYLVVAASSMQGWRNSQEDAHNSILKYDKDTSFFAVYDGHGGSEVATYCADHLPNFLKSLEAYKNGDIESALKQAFLEFDKTLLEPEVVSILKELAGETLKETAELSCEEDDEDLAELHEESSLSLKKVLKRYGACGVKLSTTDANEDDDDDDEDDDEIVEPAAGLSMPSLKLLKEGGPKPQSPYLRGRRAAAVVADAVNKAVLNPDAHPAGSSTSSAAAAAASKNEAGPSTSSVSKMETEEDSTVSSTNTVANNLSNNVKLHNHAAATAAESSLNDIETEAEALSKQTQQQKPTVTTNGEVETPDSSHIVKENEQNGSVTSSEAAGSKQKQQVSTSTAQESNHNDAIVSGSSDVTKKQQNGNSATSSSAASTSATADLKKCKMSEDDSTDDDADYDADDDEVDEQQNAMNYSSDEDDDDDEDDEFEEDDDDEEEEDEDDVDERHYVRDLDEEKANEEFCANMAEEAGQDSGCTAVVAVLHGRDLYVANAGDSRCIVCRNGKAIEMSLDHKPEDKEESARIYKAGGRVTVDGRVNGGLNLSRAIGDHAYKMNATLPAEEQMISALPDIKKLVITPEDEFMVLACDGIWNFMSNEEVVEFVRTRLAKLDADNKEISEICEELFDNCLAPNTMGDGTGCDNMTAVIVRFKPKLQQLETKINPEECEDALLAKAALITLKRTASSSLDDDDAEPQDHKRLKTDSEADKNCLETSSAITSSTTSSQSSNSEQLTDVAINAAAATASSSSSASALISTSEASTSIKSQTNDANECDSVIPDSSEAAAAATS